MSDHLLNQYGTYDNFATKETAMNEFQVTCINKPNRMSSHEHITHIGNSAAGWRLTREEAIRRIDAKQEAFYTVDAATGRKVYIAVYREAGKVPFLRTQADGKWNDNLLAQDECSANLNVLA
jgi:Protein of unknown function (DUF3892)